MRPLGVVLLQKVEGLVERGVCVDRVVRLLRERTDRGRAGVETGRDDLRDEGLARQHASQRTVGVDDVHRAHLGRRDLDPGRAPGRHVAGGEREGVHDRARDLVGVVGAAAVG